MVIQINLGNKTFYTIAAIAILIISTTIVIAYGSGDPSTHGHDAWEIEDKGIFFNGVIGDGLVYCYGGVTYLENNFNCREPRVKYTEGSAYRDYPVANIEGTYKNACLALGGEYSSVDEKTCTSTAFLSDGVWQAGSSKSCMSSLSCNYI